MVVVLLVLVCAGIGLGLGFGLSKNKNDGSNKDSQAVNNSDNDDIEGEEGENWADDGVQDGGWTDDREGEEVVVDTDDTVEQPPEDVIVSLCACLFPFSILHPNLIYPYYQYYT